MSSGSGGGEGFREEKSGERGEKMKEEEDKEEKQSPKVESSDTGGGVRENDDRQVYPSGESQKIEGRD